MMDEKSPNLVKNWRGKPKNQSGEKPPNLVGDWGKKPDNQWQYAAHR